MKIGQDKIGHPVTGNNSPLSTAPVLFELAKKHSVSEKQDMLADLYRKSRGEL